MLDKLDKAKIYASGFSVSIGLNCDPKDLGFGEENIFLADTGHARKDYGESAIFR